MIPSLKIFQKSYGPPLWKFIKIVWSPLCKCIKYPMVPHMKINQKSYGPLYENVSEILWSPLWKCTKKLTSGYRYPPPEKSQNRNSGGYPETMGLILLYVATKCPNSSIFTDFSMARKSGSTGPLMINQVSQSISKVRNLCFLRF